MNKNNNTYARKVTEIVGINELRKDKYFLNEYTKREKDEKKNLIFKNMLDTELKKLNML